MGGIRQRQPYCEGVEQGLGSHTGGRVRSVLAMGVLPHAHPSSLPPLRPPHTKPRPRPPRCACFALQLEPHTELRREGVDIHSRLHVPLWDAILGAPAQVETLRGQATIQVPPGGSCRVTAASDWRYASHCIAY